MTVVAVLGGCMQVHERSVENDFLLLTLRRLLLARRGAAAGASNVATSTVSSAQHDAAPLRLCLMSATLDGDVLSAYFGAFDVPRVSFPGRTFPVTQMHLEDALAVTRHVVRRDRDWHVDSAAARKRAELASAAAAAAAAARDDGEAIEEAPSAPAAGAERVRANGTPATTRGGPLEAALMPTTARDVSRRFASAPASVCEAMAAMDPECLNVDLIVELVGWYLGSTAGGDGAEGLVLEEDDFDEGWEDEEAQGAEGWEDEVGEGVATTAPDASQEAAPDAAPDGAPDAAPWSTDGAVLVFLAGVAEIEDVRAALLASPSIRSQVRSLEIA